MSNSSLADNFWNPLSNLEMIYPWTQCRWRTTSPSPPRRGRSRRWRGRTRGRRPGASSCPRRSPCALWRRRIEIPSSRTPAHSGTQTWASFHGNTGLSKCIFRSLKWWFEWWNWLSGHERMSKDSKGREITWWLHIIFILLAARFEFCSLPLGSMLVFFSFHIAQFHISHIFCA